MSCPSVEKRKIEINNKKTGERDALLEQEFGKNILSYKITDYRASET